MGRQVALAVAGVALAILTSLVVLLVALVTEAASLDPMLLVNGFMGLALALESTSRPDQLFRSTGTLLITIAAAPVIVTVLIGAAARLRHAAWYVGGTAALSLILPEASRSGGSGFPARPPTLVLLTFAAAGLAAGFVYWRVAIKGQRDDPATVRMPAP